MSDDAETLLRTALQERGISQNELARRTGITKPQISRYFNGAADPSTHQLRRMLAALGRDIALTPRVSEQSRHDGEALLNVLALVDYLPRREPSREMTAPSFAELIASGRR